VDWIVIYKNFSAIKNNSDVFHAIKVVKTVENYEILKDFILSFRSARSLCTKDFKKREIMENTLKCQRKSDKISLPRPPKIAQDTHTTYIKRKGFLSLL